MFLPVARSAPRRPTPRSFDGTAAARRRVLVIDDDEAIGNAVRRILSPQHDVTVTTGVKEALALIEGGERYDVILCDVMMPELGGVDFLETLAARLPDETGKVVLVSGSVFSRRAAEFLERRAQPIVDKPFDAGSLRDLVAKHGRSPAGAHSTFRS